MELKEILHGLIAAEDALRAAQEEEAGGTITAISHASLTWEVDSLTQTITIKTQNRFFAGDGHEVRCGRVGGWKVIWERELGVPTGEDFMPPVMRAWLLWYTAEDDHKDDEDHYWDTYPW